MFRHTLRSALAFLLVVLMTFSLCSTTLASAVTTAQNGSNNTIYVSIGDTVSDSSADSAYGAQSYPKLIAAWLSGAYGRGERDQVIFSGSKGTVDHRRLSADGLTNSELMWLLAFDHTNAAAANTVADSIKGTEKAAAGVKMAEDILAVYNENAANGKYFTSSYSSVEGGKYLQIIAEYYQLSLASADFITFGGSNADFISFMSSEIEKAAGGDLNSFSSRYKMNNVFNGAGISSRLEDLICSMINEYVEATQPEISAVAGGNEAKINAINYIVKYSTASYVVSTLRALKAIYGINQDTCIVVVPPVNPTDASNVDSVVSHLCRSVGNLISSLDELTKFGEAPFPAGSVYRCARPDGVEYSNGMLISAVNEYDGEEMLNLLLVDDRIPAGAKLY